MPDKSEAPPEDVPLAITFRGVDHSPALEAAIRERATKLAHFAPLLGCRVVVESPHRRHHQGQIFNVRVRLTLPGAERVVQRDPAGHHAHEDPYVAVRDAFDAARRQVEDFVRERRGESRNHVTPAHGRVVRLVPERDHGFLESAEGREIYFHRNSVLDGGFDQLAIGSEVRFAEDEGDEGPQASTVERLGKHHPAG